MPVYSTRLPVDGKPGPPSTATSAGWRLPGRLGGSQRNAMPIRRPRGRAGSSGRGSFPHSQRPPSGHG